MAMENWLKGLIAAACIVVIGAGAYKAWSHYNDWRLSSVIAERQSTIDRRERCAAYKDNSRPFQNESEGLAKLKKSICADEYPDLY